MCKTTRRASPYRHFCPSIKALRASHAEQLVAYLSTFTAGVVRNKSRRQENCHICFRLLDSLVIHPCHVPLRFVPSLILREMREKPSDRGSKRFSLITFITVQENVARETSRLICTVQLAISRHHLPGKIPQTVSDMKRYQCLNEHQEYLYVVLCIHR